MLLSRAVHFVDNVAKMPGEFGVVGLRWVNAFVLDV